MFRLTITGNVGEDAKTITTNGHSFVKFSVGVSVGYKDNQRTEWISVTCNGKLAEIAINHVKQGMKLYIEGTPSVNAYARNDGTMIKNFKLSANTIEFMSSKKEQTESTSENHDLPAREDTQQNTRAYDEIGAEEIPF